MDVLVINQFFAKIDVHRERDELNEDDEMLCMVRAILDASPTIASRALLAVRAVILSGGDLVIHLINAAEKLAAVVVEPLTSNTLFNLLLARCEDERVNSRKAAILAAEALCEKLADASIMRFCVEMLQSRCRDHSLTIRKQAADSLTNLLHFVSPRADSVEFVAHAWLNAVMSLIVDREMPVQQHAAKLVAGVLITPLDQQHSEENAWKLLRVVEGETELRRLLLRVLVFMHSEKMLSIRFIRVLNEKIGHNDYMKAAWMLLAEMSAFTQVDPSAAVQQWCRMRDFGDGENRIVQYVAKVLANSANFLNDNQRRFVKNSMDKLLMDFSVSTSHLPAVYYSFARACDALGNDAPNIFILKHFNNIWFKICVENIEKIIYEDQSAECHNASETAALPSTNPILTMSQSERQEKCERLERIVFSIGECLQYTPDLMNRHIFKLLKLLIASDTLKAIAQSTGPTPRPETPADELFGSQRTAASVNPYAESACHSEIVLKVYGKQVRQEFLTRRVRAQSVLTLGKLCLLDEKLAEICVPVFVKQLEVNPDHIVRNNIVVVVCDLCIRYTLLVDKHSAILASCLNDSSVLVRQQTLMLLTNLIKEQFLKWEGAIIFRFMIALLDAHNTVRKYAEFCLTDILLPQFPMMFFNYFLDCLFHFNHVKHKTWNIAESTEFAQTNEAFSLAGTQKFRKRMLLYKFMIKTFSDDQKYKIYERIACEVFAAICNRVNNANGDCMRFNDPNVVNLLTDSFKIMLSSDIKLSLQLGQRHVDDQADEDDPSEDHKKVAKKLIAKVFGDKIVSATIPQLLQLREFLIEMRSPLAIECFAVIMELYKDYAQNFEDIFTTDPMIKSEIEFHLKQRRRENLEHQEQE